jgi:hypothetical protein
MGSEPHEPGENYQERMIAVDQDGAQESRRVSRVVVTCMNELPRRSPGAHVPKSVLAPEGGWFGEPIDWPIEDQDETALARYLRVTELPEGSEAEVFFRRVLDGLHKLDPDTDK